MKCKVLLVGEGPSDIGDLAAERSYRGKREGFLQPLLRTMVGEDVELEFEGLKLMHLPKKPLGKSNAGKLQTNNASRALALALTMRMNVLVLACDADKSPGTRANHLERKHRVHVLRASAERGFADERKHDTDAATIHTAIAVPCRMIEAWALGDREALAGLLPRSAHSLEYGEPEALWGKEQNPKSNHPKCVWKRVTGGRIKFSDIGAAADPSALAKACPESFPPFVEDVERAKEQCLVASGPRPRRPEAIMARRAGSAAKVVRRGRDAGGSIKKRNPPRTVRGRAG